MTATAWDQIVTFQLAQAQQELASKPHLPKVKTIRSRTGTDSTGDPAVWVWVVLKAGTPPELMTQDRLNEMAGVIRRLFYPQQPFVPPAGVYPPTAPTVMPYLWPEATPYVYFEREEERS